jgi:predicted phosphodiesterase
MRLAIIADIHGNVLALDAVLADIAARGIDRIVNLGDVVSGPLWPRETAERLMPLNLPTVRGNHDRWVAFLPEAELARTDRYTRDELSADQCAWLGALPEGFDLDLGGLAVRVFHATPADDNTYLMEDTIDGRLVQSSAADIATRLGPVAPPRLVLCGHSHLPRLLTLAEGGISIVNPGSVGCPAYSDPTPPHPHVSEAGSPHGRYAIATVEDGALASVDFVAVDYDWRAAAARAESLGRADWVKGLLTGFAK